MVQNEIKMRKPKSRELIHALVQDWRLYVLLLPVVLWFQVPVSDAFFLLSVRQNLFPAQDIPTVPADRLVPKSSIQMCKLC